MTDLVLSASSVNTFIRCGHQWYLAYVAGVKAPPRIKAVRGIALHRAVEVDMRQKMQTRLDLPVEDMLDAYDTSWNEETVDGVALGEGDDEGLIKDTGYKMVKLYHRETAPLIQPDIVEQPIQFKINGQPFSGQIDVGQYIPKNLHGEPEWGLEIRDTKSSAQAPRPESYMLNMTGYAVGVRQGTGIIEADTVFDYVVGTKAGNVYGREIRFGGPLPDDFIRRFSNIVGVVSDAISAGTFIPNGPSSGACNWCGYQDMCPFYMKMKD